MIKAATGSQTQCVGRIASCIRSAHREIIYTRIVPRGSYLTCIRKIYLGPLFNWATNVSTSSSIRSSSSQAPDSLRPAIGHIQHQPLTDELTPVATSESSLPPPPTPELPPPGVPTGSQQLPATREPDAFDLHRSRCSSLLG